MNVSVVIPVKDESENISRLLADLEEWFSGAEVIFVDGSSTRSVRKLSTVCETQSGSLNAKVIKQSKGRKGAAVWQGIKLTTGDCILVLDGDRTISASDAYAVASVAATTNGLCVADRLSNLSFRTMPLRNYLYNKLMSVFFTIIFRRRCKDLFAGCKAFPAKYKMQFLDLRFALSTRDEWSDLQMLSAAAMLGIPIISYPVTYRNREYGFSKISRLKDGLNLIIFLVSAISWRRVKR